MKKMKLNKRTIFYIGIALFLILSLFGLYMIFFGPNTYSRFIDNEDIWDGKTIASSFSSGNGTKDNPYQISSVKEFAYFKQILESDNYNIYNDKNFILTKNLNFNKFNLSSIGVENKVFKGTFDGQGFSIVNLKQNTPQIISGVEYYGLFSLIEEAVVTNLNLENIIVDIIPSKNNIVAGFFAGSIKNSDKITWKNLSLTNSTINYSSLDNFIGGSLAGKVEGGVYQKLAFSPNFTKGEKIGIVAGTFYGNVETIVTNNEENNFFVGKKDGSLIDDIYSLKADIYYQGTKVIDKEVLMQKWNNKEKVYQWYFSELDFVVKNKSFELKRQRSVTLATTKIAQRPSGVENESVYINDLDSDWNYYLGKNYTEVSNNQLPTGVSNNIYNDTNLVKVQLNYDGENVFSNGKKISGYISLSERQNKLIYYKTYVVNNNSTPSNLSDDYIQIELIDNPFTDRPVNYGFNGWLTNYPGSVISFDQDIYTRLLTVPITYVSGKPNEVVIDLKATWVTASVGYTSKSSSDWYTSFLSLSVAGMKELRTVNTGSGTIDMAGYFIEAFIYSGRNPEGYYNEFGVLQGPGTCPAWGCRVYEKLTGGMYDPNMPYYKLDNGKMVTLSKDDPYLNPPSVVEEQYANANMSGYYRKKTIARGQSVNGYYNKDGISQTSTCQTTSGCEVYELIQYYKSNGSEEILSESETYYYLVTRDTNIIVVDSIMQNGWSVPTPLTLTSIYNGKDYSGSTYINLSGNRYFIRCYNDTVLENISIMSYYPSMSSDPTGGTNDSATFYGSYNNVKLGRGVKSVGDFRTFDQAMGGNNSSSGSSSSVTRYKMIVESGKYNIISGVNTSYAGTVYTNSYNVYGSDYDRVTNNNANLDVYFATAGSWGSNIYSANSTQVAISTTVKSGTFGSGKDDYSTGIYAGGRNYGTHYAPRELIYEGGYVYNIVGGPQTASNRSSMNDVFIYIKGGEIDMVTGGAGVTATYGNRLIQMTGGIVNYSIFAGSNGSTGSGSDGRLNGSGFVYVGGNAVVGKEEYIKSNKTLFGSEAGSVFGIGNGKSGQTSIGSADNSVVIIDKDAVIKNNVYGGGNFGAVGIVSNASTTFSKLFINGGIVNGSIYGGGNRNGSGNSSKTASVSISMNAGTVEGNIYGGSNESGIIYGDVIISLNGGTILNDVYGGGKGGYLNSSNQGTYVSGNINVNLGNSGMLTPVINGSIYGGSAYGTVNSTSRNTTISNKNTTIDIKNGVVKNSVFGGGKGSSSYTPYVAGNTKVSVSNGNIGKIFAGNDVSGSPNGTTKIEVSGGTIDQIYGGGNKTQVKNSDVLITNGTINILYGGSNESGTVNSSNVVFQGGTINTIYGGNNIGGYTTNSKIKVTGGTCLNSIYGGGRLVQTGTTDIEIVNTSSANCTIYGGGESASVTNTNIYVRGGLLGDVYGGSNKTGTVNNSDINITNGTIGDVYGGNNVGGTTEKPKLTISGGVLRDVYGGGNHAQTNLNTINITGGTFRNIFGGGNQSETKNNVVLDIKNAKVLVSIYGGGNDGDVLGSVTLNMLHTNVTGSVYGGGNQADVITSANVYIGGKTVIEESVFAGGNSGAIGTKGINEGYASVHITGAEVKKHVYGGCNTSVVYGKTAVYIGAGSSYNVAEAKDNIIIQGTVFGGGEANASGSDIYDFSFICVTVSINIDINGSGYLSSGKQFSLSGSIFGSGNASSSQGTSDIYIANLGTKSAPSRNVSIQRADTVIIDKSYIEFSGTTDRTNEYSDIKYSFNRIDLLKLKNNATILLKQNANLLKKIESVVDISGKEVKSMVQIDDETKDVIKNVDNRIYLAPNKNLNVATNESATSYGVVSGMMFFGMYQSYNNGSFSYGLYDADTNYGDTADMGDLIIGGSYILGLHMLNHNTTEDGFYTNQLNEASTEVITYYIEPTPPEANYYMWTIGIQAINYSFGLNASKYASLGTYELSMLDFSKGNTSFDVIGFNSEGLTSGVTLKDSNEVPKVAPSAIEANSVLGLSMKSETTEWTLYGTTKFLSENSGSYKGTTNYKTDNNSKAPSLMFYLYHAKNISLDSDLGTIVITLQARTPINEIEYEVQLITISIELTARTYDDGDFYDSSITYDKKYDLPSTTKVNITNKSQFTAYYSLYAPSDSLEKFYGVGNSYYHVLTSSSALPVGSQITMIDYGTDNPEYYYYTIDQALYDKSLLQLQTDREVTYKLSDFIKMASTSGNNTYKDSIANTKYYHKDQKIVMEEFIFIFDFKETSTKTHSQDNSILFELRNKDDRSVVNVLGIRQNQMKYSLYEVSNIALQGTVSLDSLYFYYNVDKDLNFKTEITYDQTQGRDAIIDTNYESSSMGLNVRLEDSVGNEVSSSLLTNTTIKVDNQIFHADSDGIFRVRLANKVSNLSPNVKINVGNNLPSGVYKMRIVLFASNDGLHDSGNLADDTLEFTITVVGNNNLIIVNSENENKYVNGETIKNGKGETFATYKVKYDSELMNPNLRISLYKRKIDNFNETKYEEIDIRNFFKNSFSFPSYFGLKAGTLFEYVLKQNPSELDNYVFDFKDNLKSGTYKVVFRLYDQNHLIDEDTDIIIIKKPNLIP